MAGSKTGLDIRSLDHLHHRLGFPVRRLQHIASTMEKRYRWKARMVGDKERHTVCVFDPLKEILVRIDQWLLRPLYLPECFHGSRRKRSPVTNARPHIRKEYILKLDIKNFFPSITPTQVCDLWIALGCTFEVADLLARLTTVESQLPQGFNTSSRIANHLLVPLATDLQDIAGANGASFTIYVDDITFSGGSVVLDLKSRLQEVIRQYSFRVAENKVVVLPQHERQVVTGVVVNTKSSTSKEDRQDVLEQIRALRQGQVPSDGVPVYKLRQSLRGKVENVGQRNRRQGQRLLYEFGKIDWQGLEHRHGSTTIREAQ